MREEFGDIMRVLLATAPHDKPVAASGMDVEQVSSRRLTSCGLISAIPASSLCATSTAGATNARNDGSAHKRIGLYFEITHFVEGLGKSANARTVFGATCSPVRHICATSIDLENPRP